MNNTELNTLLENNFGFHFKAVTYNNIIVAIRAYERFIKENEDFFSYDKRTTIFGHLLTYAVEKQFNDSAFDSKVDYSVFTKQVNKFKHKVLFIETDDFVINIGRTDDKQKLLPPSQYKKEYAKANSGMNMQMTLIPQGRDLKITEVKKYAEITYCYQYGELRHLCVIIPDGEYKGVEHCIDLLSDVSVLEGYVPEQIIEESIVSLKSSLLRGINKESV